MAVLDAIWVYRGAEKWDVFDSVVLEPQFPGRDTKLEPSYRNWHTLALPLGLEHIQRQFFSAFRYKFRGPLRHKQSLSTNKEMNDEMCLCIISEITNFKFTKKKNNYKGKLSFLITCYPFLMNVILNINYKSLLSLCTWNHFSCTAGCSTAALPHSE